jgi:hypothetical protein
MIAGHILDRSAAACMLQGCCTAGTEEVVFSLEAAQQQRSKEAAPATADVVVIFSSGGWCACEVQLCSLAPLRVNTACMLAHILF